MELLIMSTSEEIVSSFLSFEKVISAIIGILFGGGGVGILMFHVRKRKEDLDNKKIEIEIDKLQDENDRVLFARMSERLKQNELDIKEMQEQLKIAVQKKLDAEIREIKEKARADRAELFACNKAQFCKDKEPVSINGSQTN